MQHAQDPSSGVPLQPPAQPPNTLEDHLRGMIISHQQHHSHQNQQSRRPHPTPTASEPVALGVQPQPHAARPHPRSPTVLARAQQQPLVRQVQSSFSGPAPVPFAGMPLPQLQQQPQYPRGQRPPGIPADTLRYVPKQQHAPPHKGRGGPSVQSRFPPRHQQHRPAPPPSNLDHFPPLGNEIPREKSRPLHSVPAKHADQPRGQQRPAAADVVVIGGHNSARQRGGGTAYQWRPPAQTQYEQFFPEQAYHLDNVAKTLLDSITPPDNETRSKERLLDRLQDICRKLCPTADLIPFGSLVSTCRVFLLLLPSCRRSTRRTNSNCRSCFCVV